MTPQTEEASVLISPQTEEASALISPKVEESLAALDDRIPAASRVGWRVPNHRAARVCRSTPLQVWGKMRLWVGEMARLWVGEMARL